MSDDIVIHVVDDEEAVRKSLAFLLTMAGYTARVHESARAFLSVAENGLRNSCLITDLRMPDLTGLDLLRRLHEHDAMLPTIVVTGHGDVPMAVEAMKAGALDFIEKPFDEDVLLEAVRRAIAELKKKPDGTQDVASIRARLSQLTERERQVMAGVVAGLANKSIAYDLDISPRTVEVHRANVMAKMEARNLPDLVRMVLAASEKAS